ncbi:patatin-like phospholipase family protein [Actinomadura graeca]|uniref:Patatin-like phospholipase family protein n=1 Tax=Actinomadura graeca TaxID=2750812 RepID=A0ABX8QQP0_9ACTN|nr:CBASS cGAMP-activated phospholipase [Actinomadura graeca]QXJ21111.1 patatin-like phospholipase family protein [Actinomadura graeca]
MSGPYHVLTLDGGGLRGIFTAAVLTEIESALGPAFVDVFDLLVGTSTGGIIALGLASGRTCREMLDFYREAGASIFGRPRRLRRLNGPKHDRTALDAVLQRRFGEMRMNDLAKPVCITAYELVHGTPRVWKDDHAPGLRWGGDQLVWKVAASTSAAPTYLAPVQMGEADSLVDGGVWANNPAMVGVIEAIRYNGRGLGDLRLLSVGTTSQPMRIAGHHKALSMGSLKWAINALSLLQGSTSAAVDHQVRLLLGDAYLRLDSERTRRIALDDVQACGPLQEWGHGVGRMNLDKVRKLLDLR